MHQWLAFGMVLANFLIGLVPLIAVAFVCVVAFRRR